MLKDYLSQDHSSDIEEKILSMLYECEKCLDLACEHIETIEKSTKGLAISTADWKQKFLEVVRRKEQV